MGDEFRLIERALLIARQDPPLGAAPEAAAAAIAEVLESIGDTCPECPPGAESPAPNLAIFPHAIWHLLANQRPE